MFFTGGQKYLINPCLYFVVSILLHNIGSGGGGGWLFEGRLCISKIYKGGKFLKKLVLRQWVVLQDNLVLSTGLIM